MGMIVGLLILAAVIGVGVWLTMTFKPKGDEGVITVEPEPAPYQKTGAGTALATVKPMRRYESESPIDTGQAVAQLPEHKIVRTWIETKKYLTYPMYNWQYICGVSNWSISTDMAKSDATQHCREYARAEELKAKTNGRFSW